MERPLSRLIHQHHIRSTQSLAQCPGDYKKETIFILLKDFFNRYGEDLVLYGGQSATERMLGLYKMRSLTNDIDFICTLDGIHRVMEKEHVLYNTKYDVLTMLCEKIPVTFGYYHIHDWVVSEDFFLTKRKLLLDGNIVYSCCAEYSIMLKIRRSFHCLSLGRKMFGKDCLDIINMITAPSYRSDLKPFDEVKLAGLLKECVTESQEKLLTIFSGIYSYKEHLPLMYRDTFDTAYNRILQCI